MKSVNEIKAILTNNFSDEEDRIYWENELEKAMARENTMKNNEHYFAEMAKQGYDW